MLDANKCFEKQSPSALSLQLAAYYYSLQIYARLAPCFRDKCHPLYRVSPHGLHSIHEQGSSVAKTVKTCAYLFGGTNVLCVQDAIPVPGSLAALLCWT